MDKEKRFVIRNIIPDAVGWLQLAAPIGCDNVEIVNQTTVDLLMRTDDGNAASEMTLPVGKSYVIHVPPTYGLGDGQYNWRFEAGDPIAYFKLSGAGSGSVRGVFIL